MGSEKGEETAELSDLEVDELLRFFVGALAGKALEHMGASAKKDAVKDMKKAQLAINSISVLVDQLASVASEDEVKQLRALLSDLQLNYVMAS